MTDPYVADLVAQLDAQDEAVEQLARCAVLFQVAQFAEARVKRRLDKAFDLRDGKRLTAAQVEVAAHVAADHARWRARRISAYRLLASAMDAWNAVFAQRAEATAQVLPLRRAA
ncbi:MAG TPA: hypothetical protein VGH28_26820 [Polyangiaceae bacterium]